MWSRPHRDASQDLDRRLAALEAVVADQSEKLRQALELLEDLRRATGDGRRFARLTTRTHLALDAILRKLFLDDQPLEYPHRLTAQRFRLLSQNAEDGIVLAIFKEAGVASARFAELGCGHNGGSSGFLAQELGWSGLMIDADPAAILECRLRFNDTRVVALEARVTRESVDALLTEGGVTGQIDLLGVDIDGNDLWVWEAVTAASPRVVVIEYNALFGPTRSVAVPYDPEFRYEPGSSYFGASLTALARLGRRLGYRLVATEPRGANAFFVRDDVAPSIPECPPEAVFAPILTPQLMLDRPLGLAEARKLERRGEDLDNLVQEAGLPLVEID
jgi:hypothetical protein